MHAREALKNRTISPSVNDASPRSDRRPLYVQVRTDVLARIEAGMWKPGALLPSEFALAGELGVSQGTVRRGLDSLVQDGLLVRRQGRGTFVADHTPADVLFRFFRIHDAAGHRVAPTSTATRVRRRTASRAEADALNLAINDRIIRITRIRLADGRPFISETVVIPASRFPGLGDDGVVPNTIYDLFQHQYGVTVSHAEEQLEPVAATARVAGQLRIKPGAPLMKIVRITYDLSGRPIEWRISLCHLKGLHYVASVR